MKEFLFVATVMIFLGILLMILDWRQERKLEKYLLTKSHEDFEDDISYL